MPAQTNWSPPPPQAPSKERLIQVGNVKLWCWDTGGEGEAIILMHPGTGSGRIWSYQQPVFARAGYRVIGYSRRGHAGSESGDPQNPGTAADDLAQLADAIGIGRFHLVASAAGGFGAPDFALSFPERLLTLTLASTQGGVIDTDYRATIERLAPSGFYRLPGSFRELGPNYRAAYPAGVAAWEALEHASQSGPTRIAQGYKNRLLWPAIETIRTPVLMFTGAADLFSPPALMLTYAEHLRDVRTAVIADSGHSAYWEQPSAFNQLVLDFIGSHRAGPSSVR